MRSKIIVLLATVAVVVASCSSSSGSEEIATSTAPTTSEASTTTAPTTTTTVPPSTTATVAPTTTMAVTTTVVKSADEASSSDTEPWANVPATSDTVMVYGSEASGTPAQIGSDVSDGVTVLTLQYTDRVEMSDPRASGTAEWTAVLTSPDGNEFGGTWVAENATLTNEGGEWVGYRTGTYIQSRHMPSAVTSNTGVLVGEVHYIGQGAYDGLRMDLYTSSDGIIGSIRPVG